MYLMQKINSFILHEENVNGKRKEEKAKYKQGSKKT